MLTARPPHFPLPFFYHICKTQRNAHQEEYFALDEAELRHVISILKLLALGAHKVCRALHVSSFAYDSLFHLFFLLSRLLFFFPSFWLHVGGCGSGGDFRSPAPPTPPTLFQSKTPTSPAKGRKCIVGALFFTPGPVHRPPTPCE